MKTGDDPVCTVHLIHPTCPALEVAFTSSRCGANDARDMFSRLDDRKRGELAMYLTLIMSTQGG